METTTEPMEVTGAVGDVGSASIYSNESSAMSGSTEAPPPSQSESMALTQEESTGIKMEGVTESSEKANLGFPAESSVPVVSHQPVVPSIVQSSSVLSHMPTVTSQANGVTPSTPSVSTSSLAGSTVALSSSTLSLTSSVGGMLTTTVGKKIKINSFAKKVEAAPVASNVVSPSGVIASSTSSTSVMMAEPTPTAYYASNNMML